MNLKNKIPIIFFSPTINCNSKCITCDYWKKDSENNIINEKLIIDNLKEVSAKRLIITGGEPLLYKNLIKFVSKVKSIINNIEIRLLTNGLLLFSKAEQIGNNFDQIVISLDGSNKDLYKKIRGVDGFDILLKGIEKIKKINPTQIIRGRCTIQKDNYADIFNIIDVAKKNGLDQISFLPVNIDSNISFGRSEKLDTNVLLDKSDINIFSKILEELINTRKELFENNFIAETPETLKLILLDYFRNLKTGTVTYPICNSPEISQYIDNNGLVYPCFFLNSIGKLEENSLLKIYNGKNNNHLIDMVKSGKYEVCKNCVCPLYLEKDLFY